MRWFGGGEPVLTRIAREISELVATMSDEEKANAGQAIGYTFGAIRALMHTPPALGELLFSGIAHVFRKSVFAGEEAAAQAVIQTEIDAGLSPEVKLLVKKGGSLT